MGASLGLGVSDLAWVQLLVDHAELGNDASPRRLTAFGGSLVYTIDIGTVTPFLEGGLGYVRLRGPGDFVDTAEIVPVLGLGFDVALGRHFRAGAAARYWPLLGTALLDNPAFSSLSLRVSICTSCR